MTAAILDPDYYARLATIPSPDEHALTGGRWIGRGGVMVWEPCDEPAPPPVNVHQLIACPTCHARVDQTCRTRGGNPAAPHLARLAPRLCPCGDLAARNATMCSRCRKASRKDSWRTAQQRLRERRKEAA